MSDEPTGERRKFKRVGDIFIVTYRLKSLIQVVLRTPEKEYAGVAKDISAGGMAVDVSQKIAVGTKIRLGFTIVNSLAASESDRMRVFDLEGQVRSFNPTQKSDFRLGVMFRYISAEDSEYIAEYARIQELRQSEE